ncbi:hypothetical protein ZIOFF_064222 [Zingiber officinale]|uniref:Protein kinase domain-containing protein n=1 Tax=Zingiber officinale TaxID=94328 RepID=A0A8J5C8S3_ZINOF|nr:hypothetical protein ZIOFF_064222 [Zingiber officinale]
MLRISGFPSLLLAFAWGFAVFLPSPSTSDEVKIFAVAALGAFKNAISDDPFSRLSDWNPNDENPCKWTGVRCSSYPQSYVIFIVLSNSSLKGFLTPQLAMLHWLQELVLDNNLLIGSIPYQLSMLENLLVLDLSVNQLSGPIPPELGNLTSITKIDLHSNRFTGAIPLELGQLANLVDLRLDWNRLDGVIPGSNDSNMLASQSNTSGLCQLTHLRVANFSYNYFVGQIPSCMNYLPRSSFQGNCFSSDSSMFQSCDGECILRNSSDSNEASTSNYSEGRRHKKFSQPIWLLILEISTGALVLVFLITCIFTACNRCKRKRSIFSRRKIPRLKDRPAVSIDINLLKHVLKMNYQDLEAACEDFSNITGSYLHSVVYKGTLRNGLEIAVISLSITEDRWTSSHEHAFVNEVADLSRINHENAAKLLGYCQENTPFARMVVFEYASNGTLYEHINCSDGGQLSWLRRMKIAIGISSGLRYLHTELQPPLTISELSSDSVYLTEDFSPKAKEYLDHPEEREKLIDPELKYFKPEDLSIICNVVSLCLESEPSKRPSMQILSAMLEDGIDITAAAVLKESSLAWAELLIAS